MQFFIGLVFAWSVIDGDTVRVSAHVWPNVVAFDERIRLIGVDAPEVHAKTDCEKALAAKATAFTKAQLGAAKLIEVHVSPPAERDSFGRVLGTVMIDGHSLGDALLAAGLARPYGTKGVWCQ